MISSLNSVAMGEKKAGIVLKNCSLVNVYTNEIIPYSQIAILNDRIAYVGLDASHTIGNKTTVIDLKGSYTTPGFADPHIHIDQFILPSELVKKCLLHGTTSFFPDPIDVVSVCGYPGFKEFVKLTEFLPSRFFFVIPGGLPVDRKFSNARTMTSAEEKSALKLQNVLGLGEVFSWTKVTTRDKRTMKTIENMLENNCVINGHTAGATNKKLNAYISSGILSCHEPIDYEEVIERLRLGMWIMIREGSIRRDLKKIIPQVIAKKTYLDRLMFCSDGVDPQDLSEIGHIDHCIQESIKLGLDQISAISLATKNCFDYYNLSKDLGGIAPGKLADILVFDKLENMKPKKVFVGGQLVVANGHLVTHITKPKLPKWMTRTIKTRRKFRINDFFVKGSSEKVRAAVIKMRTEIITQKDHEELESKNGNICASIDKDVWKVAAFDRTHGSSKHKVGFLKNFGAEIGAFGSTWSFHENDMIIIGSNETDMAIAANTLVKTQGGLVVVKNNKVSRTLSLPFLGIISTKPYDEVLANFQALVSQICDAGCRFKRPHLIPLFLPFLALPELRILHNGIVDVKKRSFISVIA